MILVLGLIASFLTGHATTGVRPYLREGEQVVWRKRAVRLDDGSMGYARIKVIRCPLHQTYYEWTDGRKGVCR